MSERSTREKVLWILSKAGGRPVSGSQLAGEMGLSRNAIWKAVKSLQDQGYEIQSLKGRGYVLRSSGNILSKALIDNRIRELSRESSVPVPRLVVLDSVDSTNTYCKSLDHPEIPAVVAAEEQTAGRGRRGRSFSSPAGSGLYFSFAFKPEFPLEDAMKVTAVSAAVTHQVLTEMTGKEIGIKWVNDLYIGRNMERRKITGILTEAVAGLEEGGIERIIIGTGINCFPWVLPPELEGIAGSLWEEGEDHPGFTRNELLARLIVSMNREFTGKNSLDSDWWVDYYRSHCFVIGRKVLVETAGRPSYEAEVLDVDDNFQLVVRVLDGTEKGRRIYVSSGQVSLRPL